MQDNTEDHLIELLEDSIKWGKYNQKQMQDIAEDHLIEMLQDHLDSEQAELDE
uniref:Uncharacterized protein n=1 Tax=Ciona intestinalis TaxID=7719 RepID=F6PIB0_CIOIN